MDIPRTRVAPTPRRRGRSGETSPRPRRSVETGALPRYVAAALFLPAEIIAGYVWVARGGAALFAVLQMVVIIDLAYQVNDWMVEQSDAGSWGAPTTCGLDDNLMLLLGFAFFLFAAALAGIVCLFVFFGDCATTTAFVAMTLVFCVAVTATQLIFSENGNLLTSAAVCARVRRADGSPTRRGAAAAGTRLFLRQIAATSRPGRG